MSVPSPEQQLREEEDSRVLAGISDHFAEAASAIGKKAIGALAKNEFADCQLETFCFRSVDERVDVMSGKLGVSKQSVPPGIKSDATLLAAVHLLLALRSIVAPATAAGNVRAEERFTTWILKYPGRWECVKRVIESQRLQCTVSREWDLSTSFPRIEQMVWELASQPTPLRGDKDRGPSKQLQRKDDKDYALTADEYKAVKSKCFDSSRCLKFQTGKCDQSGDHDGREHRCASCDVVGHGCATCPQRKPGPARKAGSRTGRAGPRKERD